jgi:hypothetical protein
MPSIDVRRSPIMVQRVDMDQVRIDLLQIDAWIFGFGVVRQVLTRHEHARAQGARAAIAAPIVDSPGRQA